jgi:polygalacturonase
MRLRKAAPFLVLTITALLCGLVTAAPSIPEPPSVPVMPSGPRFNVRDYGARGDGVTDDTTAIQAAVNAAPNGGSTIYFPAGTYIANNIQVTNRNGLRFEGEGPSSILKRPPRAGNTRIATIVSSSNLLITQLAFDENGIQNYGGVNFYGVRHVTIEHTRHFDSNPAPLGRGWTDRYSYVFGRGGTPSEDIAIRHNTIDDLQLEVDFSRRVVISDNTVSRGCCTAGIGGFTLRDDAIMEDYTIERNVVIDPRPNGNGIVVNLDPPSTNNGAIRRIRIANNTIIRRTTNGNGVLVGTPNNSVTTHGNVFEDIAIVGNRFQVDPSAPRLRDNAAAIKANNRPPTIVFRRFTITGNIMTNVGVGMDLRFIHDSLISGNDIRGASPGIAVSDRMRRTDVTDNLVDPRGGIAYMLGPSGGGNTFTRNRYTGRSSTPLQTRDIAGSDVVEQPTHEPNPPDQP